MTVDAIGGVWQYACELSAGLLPMGVDTLLAVLGPRPTEAQRNDLEESVTLVETGLELDWLAPDAGRVDHAGRTIAALAEGLDADLVHLNQPALAASAVFRVPIVTTIHSCVATWWQAVHGGMAPPAFAWQTELVSRGLRRSDSIVAPTKSFAERVRRTYALARTPIVVSNGRRSSPPGCAAQPHSAFTAGRLWDKGKNIATLDRAAGRLACRFDAAGAVEGPHGESTDLRHIETLGSLDRTALAGRFATRPIYVSAALYEPFGLAVLEAASAGCALVLSNIPTLREIWDGGAIFVEPTDEAGFVAAIEALLGDDALRSVIGERARGRAARFTPARMAAGMHDIYAHALADRDVAIEAAGSA